MKSTHVMLTISVLCTISLHAINHDVSAMMRQISSLHVPDFVIRADEYKNVMDFDIENQICARHGNVDIDELQKRKISKTSVRLILEIIQELIPLIIKFMDGHKEQDKEDTSQNKKTSLIALHQEFMQQDDKAAGKKSN